jgi:hypothetical protein
VLRYQVASSAFRGTPSRLGSCFSWRGDRLAGGHADTVEDVHSIGRLRQEEPADRALDVDAEKIMEGPMSFTAKQT